MNMNQINRRSRQIKKEKVKNVIKKRNKKEEEEKEKEKNKLCKLNVRNKEKFQPFEIVKLMFLQN